MTENFQIVSALDCSTELGRIAVACENRIVIYDKWVQAATIESECPVLVMSFNLEGTRLVAGGHTLQLYVSTNWQCVWRCKTATSTNYLKYSPDGTMFCTASESDRLVKIWYENLSIPLISSSLSVSNTSAPNVAAPSSSTLAPQPPTKSKTPSPIPPPVPPPPVRDSTGTAYVRTLNQASTKASTTNSTGNEDNNTSTTHGQTKTNPQTASSVVEKRQTFDFSFLYVAHPKPVTNLEWRRTSKYTPHGANILLSSCEDNIARVWVQTLLPGIVVKPHFHLAAIVEDEDDEPGFVVHWVNNKDIHITRSIESLLQDMLMKLIRNNNNASSSTNSLQSPSESCSASENDIDELDDPNDDTMTAESRKRLLHKLCHKMNKQRALAASGRREPCDSEDLNDDTMTAESSKKLRHKLCRKMNKQRALAASGRKDPNDTEDGSSNRTSSLLNVSNNGKASPTSLVEEVDRALETLLQEWQKSTDLLFNINKLDGTLTLWQVKYLDGEDVGVFRQVQVEKLAPLKSAIPHYDATTMSLSVTAYSPSAYADLRRAYMAVVGAVDPDITKGLVKLNTIQSTLAEAPGSLPGENNLSATHINQTRKASDSLSETRRSISASNLSDPDPSILIVTQHLNGILGLWKLNFDSTFPKIQSVDLVTRITGLPVDPAWLQDGTMVIKYVDTEAVLLTKWIPDNIESKRVSGSKSQQISHSNSNKLVDSKSGTNCSENSSNENATLKVEESQDTLEESIKASHLAISINMLPQYHWKQLIELLAFGKMQRVKAILNHLVNCLVTPEQDHDRDTESNSSHWAHRSRTLSIVAQSAQNSFQDSFDIDNISSTIQQPVMEEIELDYVEVTSIKPLPLYQILEADNEKPKVRDTKSSAHEEFSAGYESIMKSRSQFDETLDEILGQSTLETLNKQKELKRLASDSQEKGSLTSFSPKKAKLLTRVLTHTHLPGLSNIDQMHLLAVADAVALFDASPEDLSELHEEDQDATHGGGMSIMSTNIAIDSLDDRGLRFLTAMRQHVYLTRCLPMKQRNELKASGIGNDNIVWAFHSESQDELISLIPCVQRNKPEWAELREYGVGWWLKKPEVLRKLIEKVAQSAYLARQDPLDAAIFYLAMKKKTLVCALLRRVNCDKRLPPFFEQDFTDPANRKKALKNAYALLGLHRFEHAAAFFILAGSVWDAVEVCINNLNDIQLAIILIRLHDNDSSLPANLRRLLFTEILGSKQPTEPTVAPKSPTLSSADRRTSNAGIQYSYDSKNAHQDPFLRSMAFWKLGDYLSSVHTLLETRNVSVSASVFNFYLFLKDQPLVTKHKSQLIEELELKKRTSPIEEEVMHCHRARSLSSGELSFDERGVTRNIKQSSTEFEVLNETTRLVDKYSDEAIAEEERRLFFATAQAYLQDGYPLLALEVLGDEDHLNLSRAQRMKFIASLQILMRELNTLASASQVALGTTNRKFEDHFCDWLKRSSKALEKICSYSGTTAKPLPELKTKEGEELEQEGERGAEEGYEVGSNDNISEWIVANEPFLRTILTYCNIHIASENSLTTVRLELLELLKRLPQCPVQ